MGVGDEEWGGGDSGKHVGWSMHEALVYSQICFGSALPSDNRGCTYFQKHLRLTSLAASTAASTSVRECVWCR